VYWGASRRARGQPKVLLEVDALTGVGRRRRQPEDVGQGGPARAGRERDGEPGTPGKWQAAILKQKRAGRTCKSLTTASAEVRVTSPTSGAFEPGEQKGCESGTTASLEQMTRPGAIESLVDKYLDATAQEEFEAPLREVLAASRRDVEAWHRHVIPQLVKRLEAELKEARIAPNVEEGTLGELLGRWNWLGMNARFDGQIGEADAAFRALLSTLRQAQRRLGRLHKGLPLHSLGWLRLPEESAAPYILAALVEDCIRDPKGFTNAPAAKVLVNVLGRDSNLFEEVEEFVNRTIPGPEQVQALARSDPELLSLVHSMNDPPGSELLHISLHFDPAIGDLLKEAVEWTRT
jgi:hypothetical protein